MGSASPPPQDQRRGLVATLLGLHFPVPGGTSVPGGSQLETQKMYLGTQTQWPMPVGLEYSAKCFTGFSGARERPGRASRRGIERALNPETQKPSANPDLANNQLSTLEIIIIGNKDNEDDVHVHVCFPP